MTHSMSLVQTYSSGAEEWRCPTCDRRFILQWEPFKRIILEQGDALATHSASKGLVISAEVNESLDLSAWEDGL